MKLAVDDRRRSDRDPHIIDSWLISEDNPGQRTEIVSANLSKHGVGFEIPMALTPGKIFSIEIGVGNQRLISQVRIANCRQMENGYYMIGAEFV